MYRKRGDFLDISNQRFGSLVAIKIDHIKKRTETSSSAYWLCVCDCGKTVVVNSGSLMSGNTKGCGGHQPKLKVGIVQSAATHIYRKYKRRCKLDNIELGISKAEFSELIQQNCYYCGIEPSNTFSNWHGYDYGDFNYNGIDRVDNNKGYVLDNCVPCCQTCNFAKRKMTKEEFFSWIEKVYALHINQKQE